jgi:SAM-dependent methyltransferase
MWELLRKLLGRKAPGASLRAARSAGRPLDLPDDDDLDWLHPPQTVGDPAPWDGYWRDQVEHGVAGFVHMFVDDGDLVDAMRANGLRTVLCVGNGVSQEPRALARAGFDVTALDFSPYATEVARRATPTEEALGRLVGGRSASSNGRVEFVVGDLRDVGCCPGPYDVVIDRKTLQLYPERERAPALAAVASRLATPGILFSHCHDGSWRPPAPAQHVMEPLLVKEGWALWKGQGPLSGRAAWLLITTG